MPYGIATKCYQYRKDNLIFTLKQIKDIAMEIKADGEWVNDSQTQSEYIGVCNGLNYLIDELEKIERNK